MSPAPPRFLVEHVGSLTRAFPRPHITLTWAQSLDSKIAGPGGKRVMLSGPESMLMTHWLRTMHDAILIGVQTVIMDDPRLKIQLVPQGDQSLHPPQPLILDPKLRMPPTARIISEWTAHGANSQLTGPRQVRQPWILCGTSADAGRAAALEAAGARVVRVELDKNGHIPPASLPGIISSLGLGSVMIEGGSRVLSSFLHAGPRDDGSALVDSIVVTVAPMFIGEGISVVPPGHDVGLPELTYVHTETMGKDAVMVATLAQVGQDEEA
ncbi:hypothetical protein CcaverHIS002_0107990 [Cutaneotrichosporon cavernicola]|uniref:2,5-diamino-6-ribosylamino-4(3H)-pyrimidinone 5'-phosphate reductase n=1 Tax=Cutaneotrichosporon cavernicola TaxID=279322 RepID=A0AA48HYZ6_9TREE|nr:uncharacterized protein CcaverHIS019_0107940 [Cutaneotrichosporon cavernicola]BEI80270.1 hypothetical protein CcaverHIS002_0107990 [Cutaneotrichosporon cavernicola]BEI88076.1 hypothetical protein CcaverHIS019_0107940 [Cutaneotrichosporon cavernicola]BEI95847.1 hypothetical protein CcaverHIS631_0107960 [Cutaneotrichosporon cavernicola]BEJ03621.1 hypothetical protein CcaverHIS641_0107960 [Cutaneotrichosporon cavernicola]